MLELLRKLNPFSVKRWSIGLWEGNSLNSLKEFEGNPILTVNDITDCKAGFIADPFLYKDDKEYYNIFFEILNLNSNKGEIGYAFSKDLKTWEYGGIVLQEKFHLSYPLLFHWKNEIYMIPESYQNNSIRLYKAKSFPKYWEFCGDIITGAKYADSTIFRVEDRFWLLTYILDVKKSSDDSRLEIWYSNELQGPWKRHRLNPICYGKDTPSRPGGRINVNNCREFYLQNTANYYGQELYRYKIKKINENEFDFQQIGDNPFMSASGIGWNALGIHSFDFISLNDNRYIACTDGLSYATLKNPKVVYLKVLNKLINLIKNT